METKAWTSEETKVFFCEILVDPVTSYMVNLEEKALKKPYS